MVLIGKAIPILDIQIFGLGRNKTRSTAPKAFIKSTPLLQSLSEDFIIIPEAATWRQKKLIIPSGQRNSISQLHLKDGASGTALAAAPDAAEAAGKRLRTNKRKPEKHGNPSSLTLPVCFGKSLLNAT